MTPVEAPALVATRIRELVSTYIGSQRIQQKEGA